MPEPIDTALIRSIAEEARRRLPGDGEWGWHRDDASEQIHIASRTRRGFHLFATLHGAGKLTLAPYIAEMSPNRVIAMLDEIDRLRKQVGNG